MNTAIIISIIVTVATGMLAILGVAQTTRKAMIENHIAPDDVGFLIFCAAIAANAAFIAFVMSGMISP